MREFFQELRGGSYKSEKSNVKKLITKGTRKLENSRFTEREAGPALREAVPTLREAGPAFHPNFGYIMGHCTLRPPVHLQPHPCLSLAVSYSPSLPSASLLYSRPSHYSSSCKTRVCVSVCDPWPKYCRFDPHNSPLYESLTQNDARALTVHHSCTRTKLLRYAMKYVHRWCSQVRMGAINSTGSSQTHAAESDHISVLCLLSFTDN